MNRREAIKVIPVLTGALSVGLFAPTTTAAHGGAPPQAFMAWSGYHWVWIEGQRITHVFHDDKWTEVPDGQD
jgi:hypothetical protein